MTDESRLSDRLYQSLFQRVGSDEHVEIAGYLAGATKMRLDSAMVEAVRVLIDETPWTVESNLDVVDWPSGPLWIEWPGYIMNVRAGGNPVSGFLVLPSTEYEGVYMVLTALETAEITARHCYAMAVLDLEVMYENAFKARRFYSKTPSDSMIRLMDVIGVTISQDFRDELLITTENPDTVEAVMRDATADIPFFLAAMVAMKAEGGSIRDLGERETLLVGAPVPKRGALGRLADRLSNRQSTGIVRTQKAKKPPRLRWFSA